jgi:hypothetical protein
MRDDIAHDVDSYASMTICIANGAAPKSLESGGRF